MQFHSRLRHFVFSFPPGLTKKAWKTILGPMMALSLLFFLTYYFVNLQAYNMGPSRYHSDFLGRSGDLIIMICFSFYYSAKFLLISSAISYVMHVFKNELAKINFAVILISIALIYCIWPHLITTRLYIQHEIISSITSPKKIDYVFQSSKTRSSAQVQNNILLSIVDNPHTNAETLEAILIFFSQSKKHLDENIMAKMAHHKNVSETTLKKLIEYNVSIETILYNHNIPTKIIQFIWEERLRQQFVLSCEDGMLHSSLLYITEHPNTPATVLKEIAEFYFINNKVYLSMFEQQVAVEIVFHSNTPLETSNNLLKKFNYGELYTYLLTVLECQGTTCLATPAWLNKAADKILDGTLTDYQGALKSALIHNPNTPKEALNRLNSQPDLL